MVSVAAQQCFLSRNQNERREELKETLREQADEGEKQEQGQEFFCDAKPVGGYQFRGTAKGRAGCAGLENRRVQEEKHAVAEPEENRHEKEIQQKVERRRIDDFGDKVRNIQLFCQADVEADAGERRQDSEIKEKQKAARRGEFPERAEPVKQRGTVAELLSA